MFRIDRNQINLAAARSIRVESDDTETDAADVNLYAAASAAYLAEETIRDAEEKASLIVDEARNEVAALLLTTREEAKEERRRAWQEGYAEGAEEGRRVVTEKYQNKMREDSEKLNRVIGELFAERELTYSGLEADTVGLTLEIAKKIIDPADEAIEGAFEMLIRNALKQIAPESKVVIRVSPTEYERFFSSGSAVFELDKGSTVTASILKDASLGKNDCLIDTDKETVNAGFDKQMEYITIALTEAK